MQHGGHSARKTCPTRKRAARCDGQAASSIASATAIGAMRTIARRARGATWITGVLSATECHNDRPSAMPSGTPNTKQVAIDLMRDVPTEAVEKIMRGNARRMLSMD